MRRDASLLADVETLRGIIDAVPHPIFVKDGESRFLIVNAAMCSFMGQPFDELVGRLDEDFVPKEQADIYVANDRRVLDSGEINENEEPFYNGSGEQRTIVTGSRVSSSPTAIPFSSAASPTSATSAAPRQRSAIMPSTIT